MKRIATHTRLLLLFALLASTTVYGQWQNQTHALLVIPPYETLMEDPIPYIEFNETGMTDGWGRLLPPQYAQEITDEGVLTMKFLYNESNWNIHFIRIFVIDEDNNETEIFARHGSDRSVENVNVWTGVGRIYEPYNVDAVIPDGKFEFTLFTEAAFPEEDEHYQIKVRLGSAHAYQTNRRLFKYLYFDVEPAGCNTCINGRKKIKADKNRQDDFTSYTDEALDRLVELNTPQISLWPNPVRDILRIDYTYSSALTDIEVYNTAGQKVQVQPQIKLKGDTQHISIDTESFIPGIYFIKLMGKTGVETLSFSKNP